MAQPPRSEPDLFSRFRSGDPDAFEVLIGQHQAALEAGVRRRLDPRLEKRISVADVVQEARVVAFERRDEFHGDCHDALRRWLLGIVANRARKAVDRHAGAAMRAIGLEITRARGASTMALRAADGTPSQAFAAKELAELAEQARGVLTQDEQELLRLVHEEGRTLKQAAEELGRSHDAVRKQHARALRRLGRAFRRLRGDSDDPI